MNNYDLTICLRVYPGIIKKQQVFCEDKFTLYKKSISSCIRWLWALKVFMYILLDNCPKQYYDYTKKSVQHIDHEIIQYDTKQWNAKTFAKQFEILNHQDYSDICLFLEDDYLHLPGSIEKFVRTMQRYPHITFGTTYYSPDYQSMLIHNYRSKLLYDQDTVYGTFASTTMTFYCTTEALHIYRKELLSYSKWNHDFSMWFSMTKLWIYNFSNMIKSCFTDLFQCKLFWYMRYKCFAFMITTPQTELYVPLLGWSTHIDSTGLSPWTDWKKTWDSITI